jgi:hypothetical protein
VPEVYIDGQKVSDQGFTQDSENYYVWFSTHFSTHDVSIDFEPQSQNIANASDIFLAVGIGVIIAVLIVVSLFIVKRRKRAP